MTGLADDSWKGEHLIRSVRRAHPNPLGRVRRDRSGRRVGGQERQCAVPGCGATLSPHNSTGVCRVHFHAVGICRCAKCEKAR